MNQLLIALYADSCPVNGSHALELVKLAAATLYNPATYNAKDLDLGLLILRLGGRRLLHALHVHCGTPSLMTIHRHSQTGPKCVHGGIESLSLNLNKYKFAISISLLLILDMYTMLRKL